MTFMSSASGWTAITTDGGLNNNYTGMVAGAASFSPTAVILGGSGSGFVQVQYTDTLSMFGGPFDGESIASAGDLTDHCYNSVVHVCDDSLTDTVWSGLLPFVFGEELSLPQISVSYQGDFFTEGPGEFNVRESVTGFNIVDANMNPLPLAYANGTSDTSDTSGTPTSTPEPSAFCLGAAGLIALNALKRHRRA